jgi:carboxyl-terminal processing protease
MKNNKGFNLLTVIIIICATSIISAITVGVIVNNGYRNNQNINYRALANDEALKDFLEAYSNITDNYYEDIDREKMLDKAVDAMLRYLDETYTTYLNDNEKKALEEKLSGTYDGIGIEIRENEIVNVLKNSPAEKAGIQSGDKIMMINETDVSEQNANYISVLIKTSADKPIELKVLRGEDELTFWVSVETITSKDIVYEVKDNNIGYLGITIFSKTLTEQVVDALNDLEAKGINRLIIDLRGNTGGYLDTAEGVASLFLEKGRLIYSLEDKDSKNDYYDQTSLKRNYPIVVLLNASSASASEILAAALKDSYGAVIVGEKSYGKGKVQQTYNLKDGSMAKYTSAKWLRPNGVCIDGIGIQPDYPVDLYVEYDEEGKIVSVKDTQLEKAIEVIGTM